MLDLDLPALILDALSRRRVDRAGSRGDRTATAALLAERGFAAHDAALAFEERYGGLRVHEPDAGAPALVIGPYACIASGYSRRERDLVPVIFGIDDTIYALDTRGRGWTCAAMVEGASRPSGRDGRQLLSQAVLWRALATHPARFDAHGGQHGARLAAARGVPLLAEATSDHESWWADDAHLIVEIPFGNGYEGPMTYATLLA